MLDDSDDDSPPEGAPAWMATFSDLCTLLLTFFVLLLSFANMDKKEFQDMLGSTREAFGVKVEHPGRIMGLTTTPVQLSNQESTPWTAIRRPEERVIEEMRRFIRDNGLSDHVELIPKRKTVVLRVKDRLAFATGSDDLKDEVLPVLDKVAEMARAFPNGLTVNGHTDDRPIHTTRFPSNWELSGARASAALRYMTRDAALPVEELYLTGHSDLQPLVPNTSDENRARNRRVEFVFRRDVRGLDEPPPAEDATAVEGEAGQ